MSNAKRRKEKDDEEKAKFMAKKGKKFVPEEFDIMKEFNLDESDIKFLHNRLGEFHSYDDFEWDYECAVLKSGSSFGEQAMLADGNRLVTVKCISDCFLAELHKDNFRKVMKKIEQKKE